MFLQIAAYSDGNVGLRDEIESNIDLGDRVLNLVRKISSNVLNAQSNTFYSLIDYKRECETSFSNHVRLSFVTKLY